MNERINNLIDQSGFGSYAEIPDTYIVHKNDLAEFSELIVRECVMKLKETKTVELPFIQAVNEHAQELPLSVYIAELKEHFGVE
jgi:hypothetical protein